MKNILQTSNQQEDELQALRKELNQLRKQADATNTFLNNIIAELPEHVYWMDLDGRVLGCNEKQARSFGFPNTKELIGKTLYDVAKSLEWDKSLADKIRQDDLEVIQTRRPKISESTIILNNEERAFIDYKKPLVDETGKIIGVLGISIDITERKKLEKKLKLSEKNAINERNLTNIYLDNILDAVPEHLYWMDKNGVVLGCNDQQAQSFGLTNRNELIGKTLEEVGTKIGWSKEMINAIRQNDLHIMQTGQGTVVEESGIFHGQFKTYISYKNPLRNAQNKVIGILGITVDITERKKMEEELVKAKEKAEIASLAKSEFLMNMSHDLRTPLNGILGFTQILEAQETEPHKKENLTHILTSARRLLNLLSEILDVSYIEAGMPIESNKFSVKDLFQQVEELMQTEIRRKGLEFKIQISENIPSILIGDKKRIDKILINLLSNAIKFTDAGIITFDVAAVQEQVDSVELKIVLKDMGIGIPQDKLEIIFDKFTRLTSSYRGVYKGTGLGLYIVKKFIEDLGGKIYVESEVGKGSTFTCLLKLKKG